jgi:L-aminopeptidase/D-esterase-like protein
MMDSITDVPGIRVGHAHDEKKARGATVVLCEKAVTAGVDVRGGSPGTRETDCLDPVNMVPAPHAFYLGGGSAFGLAGASGVMRYLLENGIGFRAYNAIVPIVPGAVIIDLTIGDPKDYPGEEMGYEACQNAGFMVPQGNVGAGTGALIGWAGDLSRRMKGGLGTASASAGDVVVGAIVVVNCWGDVFDPVTGELLGGTLNEAGDGFAGSLELLRKSTIKSPSAGLTSHTTIGVVATNAILPKPMAKRMAMMAHDGYARAIVPSHTAGEGDSIFAVSMGQVESNINLVGALAAEAMARAVANAVRNAKSAYGYPGYAEMRERMGRK